ncbi:tetraspanin-8-like [Clupea harengus]|uniref:Tetraspanin-8-like n=1 Tax=Clupea harengus TaxID=7950 RepID=A0A6P8GWD7_CLUHA|nr:tetraspanin-8-like [Clupea harengus]
MLIVFLVLMCVGFLFLVRIAVVLVMMVKSITEEQLHALLPLDKTSMDFRSIMDGFQSSMDCCGLFNGYEDWNENVPESCNCPPPEETMTDVCVVIPGNYLEAFFSQRMVYSQSCGPILLTLLKTAFDGVMGVFFGLTTLTVLGIAISSCLIARINKNRIAGVVLGPTLVFSTSPPKYNELVNEPYH